MTILTSPKGLTYKHFVLTRFWFAKGPTGTKALNSDVHQWLENRLHLFKAYCLPSVVAQSCQDFKWLIYFDMLAPNEFVSKMRDLVSPYPNVEIVTTKAWGVPTFTTGIRDKTVGTSEVLEDIKKRLAGEVEWVLTSRLDTDDGIHRDYVKRLHDAINGPKEIFLNFPNGILLNNNNSYLYSHYSNAFISLFESAGAIKTVLCGLHERLNEVAPIRQLSPTPAFLQVVHGTNFSNKPRGYRVPKILALQGFEAISSLHDSSLEESSAEIVLNNVVWGSLWYGRDQFLNQVKKAHRYLSK